MKEIRIHGRGGQGAVTSGQLIAISAFFDGNYSQSFPMFGVERSGAPVQAFARISNSPINLRSQIYNPDIVIVLDASLLSSVNVIEGLKRGGFIIINTNKEKQKLNFPNYFNIHTIDATSIALKIFNKPIINTTMLGAFAKITGIISLDSLLKATDEILLRKGKKIAELNKKAIREAYKMSD